MTINKAQGQTLTHVSVCLCKPVFSHGQLYVALSRVGCRDGIRILLPPRTPDFAGHAPCSLLSGEAQWDWDATMTARYTKNIVERAFLRRP